MPVADPINRHPGVPAPTTGRRASAMRGSLVEGAIFVTALLLLVLAAMLVRMIPIRHLLARLGTPLGPVACSPLVTRRQIYRARLIRRAISRAAALSPFRADCLPQALVGAVLCRRLGVSCAVHLGVTAAPIAAHAWLCAGPVAITGGKGCKDFTPIACFQMIAQG